MRDFTVNTYFSLLEGLLEKGYAFQTFAQYLTKPEPRTIILRHDVDARPENSLQLARIENAYGIPGTYNFRAKFLSREAGIIKEIAQLGHEIGYHYEELATHQGDQEKAMEAFRQNLEKLRKIAEVRTICMHGSPTSRHDSRDLWKNHNYRELEILGEPYFDVDFTLMLYLTDTGRRWDGNKVSIRDKVDNKQYQILEPKGYPIRNTDDIIKAAKESALPDQVMFTIHPQRWHSSKLLWTKELLSQNLKNIAKGVLIRSRR